MSVPLTEQELHNLAMNHVGRELEEHDFEFIAVNSKIKSYPQFVCRDKDKQYYFVIVKVAILPENANKYDVVWMESFKKHAHEQNAKVLFAGVGLANAADKSLPLYLNEDYLMEYHGIKEVEISLN